MAKLRVLCSSNSSDERAAFRTNFFECRTRSKCAYLSVNYVHILITITMQLGREINARRYYSTLYRFIWGRGDKKAWLHSTTNMPSRITFNSVIFQLLSINIFKVAPYSNFNGGLVTKHGVATYAWIVILSFRNSVTAPTLTLDF